MANNKDISVNVTANASAAKKELDSLQKELQELQKSGTATDAELAALTSRIQKLGSESGKSTAQMKSSGDAGSQMAAGVGGASGAMGGLIAAAKGFIGVGLVKAFAEITAQSQNLNRMLAGLFGGTKQAAQQFEFTSTLAKRLGVEVYSLTDAYVKLAAATRGTSLEGEKTQKIFSSFATAMASMGAGTNEIGDAMVQLSQGVSKGRFELEDVKSIMEKIPGSANIFAESLGRTTKEFYDMISAGQLGRAEVEKMAAGLEKVYGSDTKITGLSQSWNNFVTTLKSSANGLGEATNAGGFMSATVDVLSKTVEGVGVAFTVAAKGTSAWGKALGAQIALMQSGDWQGFKQNIADIGDEFTNSAGKMARSFFGLKTGADDLAASQEKAKTVSAEFSSAVLDAAATYTKAATASAAVVESTKNMGDASISAAQANLQQAQAVGQLSDVLAAKKGVEDASVAAAEKNAQAAKDQLALSQQRAAAISAEIERLNALTAANASEDQARAESIIKLQEEQRELDKLIPKQLLQSQNAQTLAALQRDQAMASAVSSAALLQQSVNIDALNQKHAQTIQWLTLLQTAQTNKAAADAQWVALNTQLIDLEQQKANMVGASAEETAAYNEKVAETKEKLAELEAAMAGGVAATDAIAKVTDAAKLSTEQLNTALQQRIQAQSQLDQLSQMQFDLENKNLDLKQIELKRRLDVAKARGNEAEAQRIQNELYRLEIERVKAAAVAKQGEIDSLKEKLKLAQMQAELDGTITAEEKRQIALAQQKIKIAEAEKQAFVATAKAKEDVMYATQNAVQAEREHAQAADETTQAIQGQASAKRAVVAADNAGSGGGGGGGAAGTAMQLARNDSKYKTQEAKDAMREFLMQDRKISGMSTNTDAMKAYGKAIEDAAQFAEDNALKAKAQEARKQADAERESAISALKEKAKASEVQAPSKIVRFELSSPDGKKFAVDAVGGSENQLEQWLNSIAKSKMAAQ